MTNGHPWKNRTVAADFDEKNLKMYIATYICLRLAAGSI